MTGNLRVYRFAPTTPSSIPKKQKARIPQRVRQLLWVKDQGENFTGSCKCCGEKITVHSFQAGHKISEYNGGTVCLDNLTTLCFNCNASMGSQDFDEFIEKYNFLCQSFDKYKYSTGYPENDVITTFLSRVS